MQAVNRVPMHLYSLGGQMPAQQWASGYGMPQFFHCPHVAPQGQGMQMQMAPQMRVMEPMQPSPQPQLVRVQPGQFPQSFGAGVPHGYGGPNVANPSNAPFAHGFNFSQGQQVQPMQAPTMQLRVRQMRGDGRCLFRAIAVCSAGRPLDEAAEAAEAGGMKEEDDDARPRIEFTRSR
mmetsp:Transcript_20556/g.49785  ORF Transcript_20556/g.49785 Transcript_20556/m.49785 type:complete len:177 (-) Transcript_20556:13-543(-)